MKNLGIGLSIMHCGFSFTLHGGDQQLLDLLVKKGLITQAETDTLQKQPSSTDKALLDLLVSKGHITQGEASGLNAQKAKVAETPKVFVSPKSKKVSSLKISGRIQAQYDNYAGVGSGESDREHFYFRRLFLGGHAKLGAHRRRPTKGAFWIGGNNFVLQDQGD